MMYLTINTVFLCLYIIHYYWIMNLIMPIPLKSQLEILKLYWWWKPGNVYPFGILVHSDSFCCPRLVFTVVYFVLVSQIVMFLGFLFWFLSQTEYFYIKMYWWVVSIFYCKYIFQLFNCPSCTINLENRVSIIKKQDEILDTQCYWTYLAILPSPFIDELFFLLNSN